MAAAVYDTRWGQGLVVVSQGILRRVWLPGTLDREIAARAQAMEPHTCCDDSLPIALDWARQIEQFFRGERACWTPQELDRELVSLGTGSFAHSVFVALLSTRPGETVTYGRLAVSAGRPKAARAVGRCMAKNPLPVVIPCHRVVRADGSLGQYSGGVVWKARLLALEKGARSA